MTAPSLVWKAQKETQLEKTSLRELLQKYLVVPRLPTLTQGATKACLQHVGTISSRDQRHHTDGEKKKKRSPGVLHI